MQYGHSLTASGMASQNFFCCRQQFAAELEQQPWASKAKRYFLAREEEYVDGLRAATQIWAKLRQNEVTVDEAHLLRMMLDFPGGLELHLGVCRTSCVPCVHT